MEENKTRNKAEEQQVIQEQIVPKKKNHWKRLGKTLLRITVYGVIFGLVAGTTLVLSGRFLIRKLGLEDTFRQMVGIGSTQNPGTTGGAASTKNPSATKDPKATATPASSDFVVTLPKATPEVIVTIDGNKTENDSIKTESEEDIQGFWNLYTGIAELAKEYGASLVQISAITEGVDWFEEAYETKKNATGLFVGDNGLDMLFLVNLDSVEGATRFTATFANGETVPCSILSYDNNYCLAVMSVSLSAVASMDETHLPMKANFALEGTETGTPVLVLGNPNGHVGAMEFGMITGSDLTVQVVDDEVAYFSTGITEYADGDGFVFNLDGEVIGMMNKTLNMGEKGVITAVELGGIQGVVEDTLNNIPRIYCGLRLEAVDTVMGGKYKLPEGIYVSEVLPGSPAMYAGIKNGDIITEVGITLISGVRQFHDEISDVGPNSVRIIVNRDVKGERKEQTLFMVPELRFH